MVTLLTGGSFLGNFPLSAMESESISKNVSARRTSQHSNGNLKVEEQFKEDHPPLKTFKETVQCIYEALEKKVDEDQRTLGRFLEIKELYVNGKRDEARQEYLMMVGISNPKNDQKKRVVHLKEQIDYISQFYRTTMKLATNIKINMNEWSEGNKKYPRDNMEAYLIGAEINSCNKAVCEEFDRINKKSEELHLPAEYNFLNDYLIEIKNKKVIFLKQLSSQIRPFAEKMSLSLKQDFSMITEYTNQMLLLLSDEKKGEENKPTLENNENNKSPKKKSKKKKKRHPKGKSRKTKTQEIPKEEVSSSEINPKVDSHSSLLQAEGLQNTEKEEILVSASTQSPQTEAIEPSEEVESKDDLVSEVEDQQAQHHSEENEDAPKVKRKLKSTKKENPDREQPNIDSEEKTSDKKTRNEK